MAAFGFFLYLCSLVLVSGFFLVAALFVIGESLEYHDGVAAMLGALLAVISLYFAGIMFQSVREAVVDKKPSTIERKFY